jgi:predicted AlkP superfamily pyrophosphatase or phosphodiesterase
MRKLFFALFLTNFIFAQERPKLVVGIVIDQMKPEYLYRFQSDFSETGFKKLMKIGYTFHNTHYNYFPTFTAPGHATIYTGANPNAHGIIANEWYDKQLLRDFYCTEDESVSSIGLENALEGKMSPKNLLSTTVTDELKLTTNFKSKVIGISLKDRGAILPAGHFADWAFWYNKNGSFISSTFYGEKLPDWVTSYNATKPYEKFLANGWNLLKPKEAYNESLTDNNPYEGKIFKKAPFFPIDTKDMLATNDPGVIRTTPFGNDLILDFGKKAIENEQMGKDEVTDFLCLSFSSTDYIGHAVGTRAIETQDTYLRLDQNISDLIDYLDKEVGKNSYVLFITADHGGAENPTFLKDKKYAVESLSSKNIDALLSEASKKKFADDYFLQYSNQSVFINLEKAKQKGVDVNKIKSLFTEVLLTQNFVRNVYSEEQIAHGNVADETLEKIVKGYDPKRSGQLVVMYKPGFMDYGNTGTTHGSPYSYDTHVPLIFYGKGIKIGGESFDKKDVTQIAPTLSSLLRISFPNSSENHVLDEMFSR